MRRPAPSRRSRLMLPPSMRTLLCAAASSSPDEIAAAPMCPDRNSAQWVSDAFLQIPYPVWIRRNNVCGGLGHGIPSRRRSGLKEVLREAKSLTLVIRSDALSVHGRRRLDQAFENETPDDL